MTKPTKRKAFNFLRSYFDVLNELESKDDKLDFLLSVINKQFLNETPKGLSFVANLCYESQRHSIESSVKGYEQKTGNLLKNEESKELQGGMQGGMQGASVQEEEKEKEKEKEEYTKEDINFLYSLYPTVCPTGKRSTGKSSKDKTKIKSLLKEKTLKDIKASIIGYLTNTELSNSQNNFKVNLQNFNTFLNNIPEAQELREQWKLLQKTTKKKKDKYGNDLLDISWETTQ